MQSFEVVRHREDLWSVMSNGQIVYSYSTLKEADDAALILERLSGVCCRYLHEEHHSCGALRLGDLLDGAESLSPPPVPFCRPHFCACLSLTWWGLNKRG